MARHSYSDTLTRRGLQPFLWTQFLGAFNDNLFKNAMVLFVVYQVYQSEQEGAQFSAIASAIFILPFFVLSARLLLRCD